MEGIARANHLPSDCWTFWQRRSRAFHPCPTIPRTSRHSNCAGSLRPVDHLVGRPAPHHRRKTRLLRCCPSRTLGHRPWAESSASPPSSTTWAPPLRQSWHRTLPGAVAATVMWFLTTLAFGWYVTRFANYSQVYGSLGAGIALLFWLYIVFLSVSRSRVQRAVTRSSRGPIRPCRSGSRRNEITIKWSIVITHV